MYQSKEKADLQNDLKRFMSLHKLSSLSAVRNIPVSDLLNMQGFGYRMLLEIVLNANIKKL